MSRPFRVVAALLSAAVVAVGGASVAEAADGWLPGPSFGAAAIPKDAPVPGLLVAPDGTVTTSWNQLGPDDRTVALLQRTSVDGRQQQPVALMPTSNESVVGAAAPGPDGSTRLVVSAPDSDVYDTDEVWLVTVDAAGTIASSRQVADAAELVASLGIGTDAAGNAVVTWAAYDDADVENKLYARRFGADGTAGPVQTLGHVASGTPQVALTADGAARIAWTAHASNAPWLARLTPAGQLDGTPQKLADQGAAGVTANGADAVAWWVQVDGALRVVRAPSSGPLTGAQVTQATGAFFYTPAIATTAVHLAADGTTTAAWTAGVPALAQISLRMRTVAPGGAVVADADLVPTASMRWEFAPQLLPTGPGRFLAAWFDYTQAATRIVAREVAGDGSGGPEAVVGTPASEAPADVTVALAGGVSDAGVVSLGWLGRRETDSADRYTLFTARRDVAPPALTAEASAAVQVGAPASFTASASDPSGVASLRWEFGDDSGSDRATTTHVYGAPGTYVATATAVDSAGNAAVVRRAVVVSAVPTPPDRTPGRTTVRAPAKLKLAKVVRSGAKVRVSGSLDRRASGRVALVWSQRLGRFTVRRSFGAKIARGRFAVVLRLPAALAKACTKATLTVTYRGDADTRAATVRTTVTAPKSKPKPKRAGRGGR
jgi:hypothetical protein